MSHDGPHQADSAGVPWTGRDLAPNPFAGDDGSADPAVLAALEGFARGEVSAAAVVAALAGRRLMVPVIAVAGDEHPLPDHIRGDGGADMSIPLLGGRDGRQALPAFTGMNAVTAWQEQARPVPVEAERAALSAVDEGCVAMVIDAGSAHAFTVSRPALWALAQGQPWTPSYDDPQVAQAVRDCVDPLDDVVRAETSPGTTAELAITVLLRAEASDRVPEVLTQVSQRLAQAPLIAERADSVQLRWSVAAAST